MWISSHPLQQANSSMWLACLQRIILWGVLKNFFTCSVNNAPKRDDTESGHVIYSKSLVKSSCLHYWECAIGRGCNNKANKCFTFVSCESSQDHAHRCCQGKIPGPQSQPCNWWQNLIMVNRIFSTNLSQQNIFKIENQRLHAWW